MILYEKDWNDYPSAIVQQNTKNKSFVKLAEIYHKMGIKNCDFHLTLLDPDLLNVDPHDPELSPYLQAKVLDECINNFWYFLREVARVPLPGSTDGTPFRANRSNIALFWLYHNHITTINTVIRQTGKTTNLACLSQWLLNFGAAGYDIGLVTKDAGLKQETMGDIKKQFEYLPDYLNMKTKKDVMNTDIIRLEGLENSLTAMLSNASEKEADKVGRGLTLSTLFIDEAAFIKNIAIALSAATMSGNAARTVAADIGNPYGTIMTTTAGDIDSRDGKYIYTLLNSSTLFTEDFFDCTDLETLEKHILRNSSARDVADRKPIVNLTMSYRQMGYSTEWMKKKLSEVTSSDENIERDLFNKWISGSSSSPLSTEDKERLQQGMIEDPRIEIYAPFGYVLRWFITEEELKELCDRGHQLIIGIDTSDAGGRDDVAFYVRDSATGEIVCGALFNETSLFTLSDFFVDFLMKYKNSTMIVERKHSGGAMIDFIMTKLVAEGINPFTRLFNTVFQEKTRYEKEYKEVMQARKHDDSVFMKYKSHVGFATAGSGQFARRSLYGPTMHSALKYGAHTMHDQPLISQYLGLQIKNGRIDHADGGHDDAVIASLLSQWFLTMGRNLHLYGMDPDIILRKNDMYLADRYRNKADEYERSIVDEKEREVAAIIEKMKHTENDIILEQMARRLSLLYVDLKRDTNEASVTEVLASVRKIQRMNRIQQYQG